MASAYWLEEGEALMPKRKTQLFRRDYSDLEELGEILPRKAIAARLGMLRRDFDTALKENPTALLRLEAGEAKREASLVESLIRKSKASKSPVHEMFLLKALHGYVDNPKPDPPQPATNIQIQLPAALPIERYREEITAHVKRAKLPDGVQRDD